LGDFLGPILGDTVVHALGEAVVAKLWLVVNGVAIMNLIILSAVILSVVVSFLDWTRRSSAVISPAAFFALACFFPVVGEAGVAVVVVGMAAESIASVGFPTDRISMEGFLEGMCAPLAGGTMVF
jgi:hypothetical protein